MANKIESLDLSDLIWRRKMKTAYTTSYSSGSSYVRTYSDTQEIASVLIFGSISEDTETETFNRARDVAGLKRMYEGEYDEGTLSPVYCTTDFGNFFADLLQVRVRLFEGRNLAEVTALLEYMGDNTTHIRAYDLSNLEALSNDWGI